MKRCALTLFMGLVIGVVSVYAQISIAPTTLFIDDQTRFGTFLVLNNSEQPQEIMLEFMFGYPASDDAGNTVMVYDDQEREARYSVADHVRGFPRNFTLQPGERQTVRLTVRPPADIPDGTYWTRIKTISNPISPDIDDEPVDGVRAQIAFRFESITAGFYKKGDVTTGLNVRNVEVRAEDDKLSVLSHLTRTGNSPYLGSKNIRVYNASNELVHESSHNSAIYFDAIRKVDLPRENFPAGNYRLELLFETSRSDISQSDLIQSAPVRSVTEFSIGS